MFKEIGAFSQFATPNYLGLVSEWELQNSAETASNGRTNVLGEFERQYAGFKGAPSSLILAFDSHLPFASDQAVGLTFANKSEGFWTAKRFALRYAYRFKVKKAVIGLGLDLGFIDSELDFSDADPTGGGEAGGDTYHKAENADQGLLKAMSENDSDILFDMGAGISLKIGKWKAGVSVEHLNNPKAEPTGNYQFEIKPLMFVYAEYTLQNHEKTLKYKPALMLRSDFAQWEVGMMNVCSYREKFYFGLNMWFVSSISFMLGYEVYKGLSLYYNYALPTSGLVRSGGSHDVLVRYSFDFNFKRNNKYVDTRTL